MHDIHVKNNELAQEAIRQFLRKIHYENTDENLQHVFDIVAQVFHAAGQKNLLALILLRKYWLEQMDEFLARHSYPRNLSISKEFIVTSDYLTHVRADETLPTKMRHALTALEGSVYPSSQKFLYQVRKTLKQALSEEEQERLLQYTDFKSKETVLHLTVYDGGFTQAIHFDMPLYLKQINAIVPDVQIDRIQCHVGNVGQARQDQVWVGKMAADWSETVSPKFSNHCAPAFIHRTSYREATLVVYVPDAALESELNNSQSSQELLNQIFQAYPDLRFTIQRVWFIVQTGMHPTNVRSTSMILGESAYDPISSYERLRQLIQKHTLPTPQEVSDNEATYQTSPSQPKIDPVKRVQELIQQSKANSQKWLQSKDTAQ